MLVNCLHWARVALN